MKRLMNSEEIRSVLMVCEKGQKIEFALEDQPQTHQANVARRIFAAGRLTAVALEGMPAIAYCAAEGCWECDGQRLIWVGQA